MYQVSLKSEGVRPFFVITWPGITLVRIAYSAAVLCRVLNLIAGSVKLRPGQDYFGIILGIIGRTRVT